MFSCSKCPAMCSYPSVLLYDCLNKVSEAKLSDGGIRNLRQSYDTRPEAIYHRGVATLGLATLWIFPRAKVKNVIKACGRDPQTTTCQEMDAEDVRLSCSLCRYPGSLLLMTWRTVVCVMFIDKGVLWLFFYRSIIV